MRKKKRSRGGGGACFPHPGSSCGWSFASGGRSCRRNQTSLLCHERSICFISGDLLVLGRCWADQCVCFLLLHVQLLLSRRLWWNEALWTPPTPQLTSQLLNSPSSSAPPSPPLCLSLLFFLLHIRSKCDGGAQSLLPLHLLHSCSSFFFIPTFSSFSSSPLTSSSSPPLCSCCKGGGVREEQGVS